jgi:hypothetical protein
VGEDRADGGRTLMNAGSRGHALEKAVHAIESTILRTAPGYADKTFRIESRKILNISGVHHEIDIWVEIDLGRGYKSRFIFECKNWQAPVGKNEVIVFSEKIDAVQAQTGFLVVKDLTRDAEAQAGKDPRIQILKAFEFPSEGVPVPFEFHWVLKERTGIRAEFFERGAGDTVDRHEVTFETAKAILGGNPIALDEYLKAWGEELCQERLRSFSSGRLPEDLYHLDTSGRRDFTPRELTVDDREIEMVRLLVDFDVRIIRPAVISQFEVSTRGRVVFLAPVSINGSEIQIGFTALS